MTVTAPELAAVKHALRIDADFSDAQIQHAVEAATALVNRLAPGAPQRLADEAIYRMCAWLYEGGTVGGSDAGMWRRSGAEGLLSPWVVRRAGLAG